MNRLTIGSIVTATLLLVGCGSNGSSTSSSLMDASSNEVETPAVAQKNLRKGYYVDSAVEGVTFQCGDESGVTDENGTFTFASNSDCNFTIGGINLRDINASMLEDNITIVETNTTIAQLLQTLDSDGNASNGIQISESANSVLNETLSSVDDLNPDILEAVHGRLTAEHSDEYNGTVVDKNQTVVHLNATKADLAKRQVRTNLDMEAEHRGRMESNNTVAHEDNSETSSINMSNHAEEGRTDSNITMGNITGTHSGETNIDSNGGNASSRMDSETTMGNITGTHSGETNIDSNGGNASSRMDSETTMGTEHSGSNRDENTSPRDTVADSFGGMMESGKDKDDDGENHTDNRNDDTLTSTSTMTGTVKGEDSEHSANASTHAEESMDSSISSTDNDFSNMRNSNDSDAEEGMDSSTSSTDNNFNSENEEHSGHASTQNNSTTSSNDSESSSNSSVEGAMGGFGRH